MLVKQTPRTEILLILILPVLRVLEKGDLL